MTNYFEKMSYLIRKQNGLCPIAEAHDKYALPQKLHHRLHNTKVNKRLYPLFIDSVWNLMAVSHKWHMMYGSYGKIFVLEATKREAFLERHPMIAVAVNMKGTDNMYVTDW